MSVPVLFIDLLAWLTLEDGTDWLSQDDGKQTQI